MKYSQLISFNPIEDVIQLVTAGNKDKAREYVKTYVMSDSMAEGLQAPLIDQLQMDEVVDNKGVLIVGNYGTGKSHLMSVISAIATDADNLQYLQNQKFAKQAGERGRFPPRCLPPESTPPKRAAPAGGHKAPPTRR